MKINVLSFIIVLIALLGGIYWFFIGGSSSGETALLTSSSASDNPAQAQFDVLVRQLQPISFDTSIFSNPSFTSLVDLTTPVTPENPGRIDPFAPIESATAE